MHKIYLHNTTTRRKEEFVPIDEKNVRMYVCGPTVYDRAHLGNARTAVLFDVWFRLLNYVYGKENVVYASNITDVDDKILNKAAQTGKSIGEITKETTEWYLEDMGKLNVLDPSYRPKATEFIAEMIELVQKLIENGNAYEADGHVLFAVDTMKNYGFLSGRPMKELIAGARVEVASYKKNPADFILWKPADALKGEQGWDSPWGYGRPGWHLECSAMSSKYLGNSFDIHGGGNDLIFPHHENECAQSLCAHPKDSYARYWLHSGMLMINGEKMSKSLGNFYTVDEIVKEHPAEALRLAFLTTHYHQPYNFTMEALQGAKATLDKFYNALNKVEDIKVNDLKPDERVVSALCDDLNVPLTLSYLHEIVNLLNKAETLEEKSELKSRLLASAELIGLLYNNPKDWFKFAGDGEGIDEDEINCFIEERAAAKKNKDFALADKIRDELKEKGVILEDSAEGTTWKKL